MRRGRAAGPALGASKDLICGRLASPGQLALRDWGLCRAPTPRGGSFLSCGREGERHRFWSHVTCVWVIMFIAHGIELCSLTRCKLIFWVKIIQFVRKKNVFSTSPGHHLKQCLCCSHRREGQDLIPAGSNLFALRGWIKDSPFLAPER